MTDSTVNLEDQLIDLINDRISKVEEPVTVDTDLLLTGTVDSLGVVQITVWIEDELGITVDPLDVVLENFQTVRQISDYVKRSLAQ